MSAEPEVKISPLDAALKGRKSPPSFPKLDPFARERRATPLDMSPDTIGEATFPHLVKDGAAWGNAQTALRGLFNVETTVHKLQAEGVPGPHIAKRGAGEAIKAVTSAHERVALLTATQTRLINQMDALLPKASDAVSGEIRAWIRAQPNPLSAAMGFITTGDAISANAVLRAPEFLSGLDQKNRWTFQLAVRKAFTPDQQHLLEDIDRAVERVEAAIRSFQTGLMPRLTRWANEIPPAEKVAVAFPTDIERLLAK